MQFIFFDGFDPVGVSPADGVLCFFPKLSCGTMKARSVSYNVMGSRPFTFVFSPNYVRLSISEGCDQNGFSSFR